MSKKQNSGFEPMDPQAKEGPAQPITNNKRLAYALKTLIAEVSELFPETIYEVGDYDERNAALGVVFYTEGEPGLEALLDLVRDDQRVREVLIRQDAEVAVHLHPSARTKDLRDPFGLGDAWAVLSEEYETSQGPDLTVAEQAQQEAYIGSEDEYDDLDDLDDLDDDAAAEEGSK